MSKDDRVSLSKLYALSEPQTVSVYFRNTRKQAKLVPLRTPAKACDLIAVASIRFNIPDKRIILFYNGFRIDNYSLPINLMEKGIIHILDRRNIDVDTIAVSFKSIGWNIPAFRKQVSSEMTVQQVVDSFLVPELHVQANRFFIVYIGKVLNLSNTLREELVENGAELLVVEHKGTKEAYEFNSSQHLRPLTESPAIVNMPVTFNASVVGLKKKNQDQAVVNQQQHSLQSSPPGLDDSFFPNSNQKKENVVAPPEKKEQNLPSQRSNGPSGEDNTLKKGRGDCAPDQQFKGPLLVQTNYNILKHGPQITAPTPSVQQDQKDSEQAKKNGK